MLDIYGNLVLLQKGFRSYDSVLYDLKSDAISNRKKIGEIIIFYFNCLSQYSEDILNRPDMRKI